MVSAKRLVGGLLALAAGVVFIYRDLIFREEAKNAWVGKDIPHAQLQGLSGKKTDLYQMLSEQTEEKSILVLWATWCEPCVQELPALEKNLEKFRQQGIRIYFINYDGPLPEKSLPEVKAWLIAQKLSIEPYFDFGEEILKPLFVGALPYSLGLRGHKILWTHLGELDGSRPEKIIGMFR